MKKNETKRLSELEALGHKFVFIASNSTEYWREDIKKRAKKILTYSLVNLTQPTNLCSPEINFPSQELYHRFKQTKGFDEDTLTTLEHESDNECRYLLERENVTVVYTWEGKETEEEIIEYLAGNPIEL